MPARRDARHLRGKDRTVRDVDDNLPRANRYARFHLPAVFSRPRYALGSFDLALFQPALKALVDIAGQGHGRAMPTLLCLRQCRQRHAAFKPKRMSACGPDNVAGGRHTGGAMPERQPFHLHTRDDVIPDHAMPSGAALSNPRPPLLRLPLRVVLQQLAHPVLELLVAGVTACVRSCKDRSGDNPAGIAGTHVTPRCGSTEGPAH